MAFVRGKKRIVSALVSIYLGHDVIQPAVPNHNHFYYATPLYVDVMIAKPLQKLDFYIALENPIGVLSI